MKYLVIAGNLKEVQAWAIKNGIRRRDYKYASSPEALLGVVNMKVIEVGTPRTHRQYAAIRESIDMCIFSGHLEDGQDERF